MSIDTTSSITSGPQPSLPPVVKDVDLPLTASPTDDFDPFSRHTSTYSRDNSRLTAVAQNIGRGVFSASTKAASQVDAIAKGYTNRNAATSQPVVLKQTTKNGIETLVRGSVALARVTGNSTRFVTKHGKRAGQRAAVIAGNGKGMSVQRSTRA